MLKFFFVCLLLANGALFAYQQGYLATFFKDGREPSRASRQLNADKIKLISAAEIAAATAPPPANPTAPTLPTEPIADAIKKAGLTACTEIAYFSDTDAAKFEKEAGALALGDRLSRHKLEDSKTLIVVIPPQSNKDAADKKANELRRLGVADFFVVQNPGALQWAIKLGTFKTPDSAKTRLAELKKKGVSSARISPENGYDKRVSFQLRNLDADTQIALDKIKSEFTQLETRDCQ